MTTANADELKPSQIRSLERSLDAIEDVRQVLQSQADGSEDTRDRERALKKAESLIQRSRRSLERLPDVDPRIQDGLASMDALNDEIDSARERLNAAEKAAEQRNQEALAGRLALLSDPKTDDDVARMDELTLAFRHTWQAFSAIDERFTHGMFKIRDEETLGQFLYVLEHQEDLLEEAAVLLEAYEPLTDTREGVMRLLSPVRSLRENAESLQSALPEFVRTLDSAQQKAAAEFAAVADKAMGEFERADKERDTSALLNMNPAFPQWDPYRNRLLTHVLAHRALGEPHGSSFEANASSANERADAVSARVSEWQQARRGEEAEALAKQQAEARARGEANARQAEQDRLAWEERRRRLDAEREARHQRLIQLRQVGS